VDRGWDLTKQFRAMRWRTKGRRFNPTKWDKLGRNFIQAFCTRSFPLREAAGRERPVVVDWLLCYLCVSHKIVETYRNQHAPKLSKGKWEWRANGSTDQSHLRKWHLLRTGQNIVQAPCAFDRMDMCAIKVFNQSKINQTYWSCRSPCSWPRRPCRSCWCRTCWWRCKFCNQNQLQIN
jgi:hypothetical protein